MKDTQEYPARIRRCERLRAVLLIPAALLLVSGTALSSRPVMLASVIPLAIAGLLTLRIRALEKEDKS